MQQQQQASAFFAREAEKAATETPAAVTSTQSLTYVLQMRALSLMCSMTALSKAARFFPNRT